MTDKEKESIKEIYNATINIAQFIESMYAKGIRDATFEILRILGYETTFDENGLIVDIRSAN